MTDKKDKIAKLLFYGKIKKSEIKDVLDDIRPHLDALGIALVEDETHFAIAVQNNKLAEKIQEKDTRIKDATLETLIIIAYCGPISKEEIDAIRFVNSQNALKKLSFFGLINKIDDKYTAKAEVYALLGVSSQEELEDRDEFCKKLKDFIENYEND